MKCIFGKIAKSLFSKDVSTTFDGISLEASDATTINTYLGIKTEISKTIAPFLQLSKVSMYNKNDKMYQLFATLSLKNSIFQVSTDKNKNFQLRGSLMTGILLSKFNTIISANRDIFSQIEMDLRNRFNNFSFKMIQPAIKGANLIYVFNFFQQCGALGFGTEIIGSKSYIGLTFAGRFENSKSISSVSLQQFSNLSLSYYRKINDILSVGVVSTYSKHYPLSYSLGIRLKSKKCEVKSCLTSDKKILFSYEDKLTEGLSFNTNCEFSKDSLDYGYGFNYEF